MDRTLKISTIPVPGDGSCFFHAILHAISSSYHQSDKRKMVMSLRNHIADMIPTYYSILSRGEASTIPGMSMGELERSLRSGGSVGEEVIEITSIVLKINIFIIDSKINDKIYDKIYDKVYQLDDILYRRENHSVILMYDGGHYDLGCIDDRMTYIHRDSGIFDILMRMKNGII